MRDDRSREKALRQLENLECTVRRNVRPVRVCRDPALAPLAVLSLAPCDVLLGSTDELLCVRVGGWGKRREKDAILK